MPSSEELDPYRVLGVQRGATDAQVQRAYRLLAKRHHPDLHGPDAARRMQDLNNAVRILADPDRRRAWDESHAVSTGPGPHWGTTSHTAAEHNAPQGPSTWAAWESAREPLRTAPARVQVRGGWPRSTQADPAPPTGLRDSPWLAVGVAATLVVLVVILGWIASSGPTATSARQAIGFLGISPASSLPLDAEHELAVYRTGDGSLGLLAAERTEGQWQARELTLVNGDHPLSVILYTESGTSDGPFSTVAFGRAAGGVTDVRLIGVEGRGGDVANGTWSVALQGPIDAEDLEWEFLLRDGTVLLKGSGELGR